jgi:hypothetical protein
MTSSDAQQQEKQKALADSLWMRAVDFCITAIRARPET